MASIDLTDHFLIAMPAMEDPCFSKSLIYVAEHNEQGALGVMVNRPIDMTLDALLHKIDMPCDSEDLPSFPVFFGGPVQMDRGFVLHRPLGNWQSTLAVNGDIGLTTSRDVLQSLGHANHPRDMVIALGYSGWGSGQLEHELAENCWLTVAASPHILFELPYEHRFSSALELLGIDLANLAEQAGHA